MTKRNKLLPLTETTFYILTALKQPSHGYQIMQTVENLSGGDVRIAAGTMYGALENLLKQKLIALLPVSGNGDSRRKVYQITTAGLEILQADIVRIQKMLQAAQLTGGQL